jgi:hypothetical protein
VKAGPQVTAPRHVAGAGLPLPPTHAGKSRLRSGPFRMRGDAIRVVGGIGLQPDGRRGGPSGPPRVLLIGRRTVRVALTIVSCGRLRVMAGAIGRESLEGSRALWLGRPAAWSCPVIGCEAMHITQPFAAIHMLKVVQVSRVNILPARILRRHSRTGAGTVSCQAALPSGSRAVERTERSMFGWSVNSGSRWLT